jgi:hypothetical protein
VTSSKKTRFLDAKEIDRGIAEIAALVSEERTLHVALIGGAALQVFGSDRLTKDVDFAVDGVPSAITRIHRGIVAPSPLSFGGIKGETASGVPVDLVVRADKYRRLYETAIGLAERVDGVPVPVVRPEFLIAMKMVAARPKDEIDLVFLVLDSGADLGKAKAIVEEFLGPYAADDLARIHEEAEWRRQRGR